MTGLEVWRESTHEGPEARVAIFFERVDRLEKKLGPIVIQPPPWWGVDAGRLEVFLAALPRGYRYALSCAITARTARTREAIRRGR